MITFRVLFFCLLSLNIRGFVLCWRTRLGSFQLLGLEIQNKKIKEFEAEIQLITLSVVIPVSLIPVFVAVRPREH